MIQSAKGYGIKSKKIAATTLKSTEIYSAVILIMKWRLLLNLKSSNSKLKPHNMKVK